MAASLTRQGYADVAVLRGGVNGWIAAAGTLEYGPDPEPVSGPVDYARAEAEITQLVRRRGPAVAQGVVDYLHDRFPHYSWVGIYWMEGSDLVLGPWKGPEATEHTRIPIGTGVCGAAAASGKTEVVPDVSKDPRYLACFPDTRSEIVVPILRGSEVIGEIDIDSSELNAFGSEDQRFLERVSRIITVARP